MKWKNEIFRKHVQLCAIHRDFLIDDVLELIDEG